MFRKRSLIDIVIGTYYKDAKSLIQEDIEGEENDSEKTDKIVTVNYVDSNERTFNEKENENIILSDKKNEDESAKGKKVQKKNHFLIYIIPLFLCICLFSNVVINKTLPFKHLLKFNKYYTERFINYDDEKISFKKDYRCNSW